MRLFIAEKPELAKAIVEGLGGGHRNKGYYDCGESYVTWCFGHMLQLFDPEDYDKRFKLWKMSDLPISHVPWKRKVSGDKKEQLDIILGLIKQANEIVNAGDPDPEGQLLVDEILDYAKCSKPVKRVLINDNNTQIVKKALANLKDNSEFKGLSLSAEARSVADQLYGYNLTRAYTLSARQAGFDGVLSVGRVQTPILGLVVRRDLLHEAHTKSFYHLVSGEFDVGSSRLSAKYKTKESDPIDDKSRLIDKDFSNTLAANVDGHPCTLTSIKTQTKHEAAPLPYNLIKLQTDASNQFGLKPDVVKEITQNLREKHRLITYNRSDCQYLSEEQHEDAADVLEAIGKTLPDFLGYCSEAKPSIKSRAFDSSKVSAHHAIIPTQASVNLSVLSENEKNIYQLIAKAYVAQFFEKHEYQQSDMQLSVNDALFECINKVTLNLGWRVLYAKEASSLKDDSLNVDVSGLEAGMAGQCVTAKSEEKTTKPPARYTIATLLTDLTRVAKYIKDDTLSHLLVKKDADKAGENGGIGTPATRDSIIKALFDRGFLSEKGKHIISTVTGRGFYNVLPDNAKYPDMTAKWHEEQLSIQRGDGDINNFISSLVDYLRDEIASVTRDGLAMDIEKIACPDCDRALRRIKGKKGYFWGCTGYQDGCKSSFPDKGGKALLEKRAAVSVSTLHQCTQCGKGLIRREAKKKWMHFWGCSGYPNCKQTYFDSKGKPNYGNEEKSA